VGPQILGILLNAAGIDDVIIDVDMGSIDIGELLDTYAIEELGLPDDWYQSGLEEANLDLSFDVSWSITDPSLDALWYMLGFTDDDLINVDNWCLDATGYILTPGIFVSAFVDDIVAIFKPWLLMLKLGINVLAEVRNVLETYNDLADRYNHYRAILLNVMVQGKEAIAEFLSELSGQLVLPEDVTEEAIDYLNEYAEILGETPELDLVPDEVIYLLPSDDDEPPEVLVDPPGPLPPVPVPVLPPQDNLIGRIASWITNLIMIGINYIIDDVADWWDGQNENPFDSPMVKGIQNFRKSPEIYEAEKYSGISKLD
jgi:hypothetical protein